MGSFSTWLWLIAFLIFSPVIFGLVIMGPQKPVLVKHSVSGLIQKGYSGYGWTYLLFGWLVPVVRGEIAIGVFHLILTAFTFGFFQIIMPYLYNKQHMTRLLTSGWQLVNDQPEVNKTAELNTSDAASLRIDKKNFDPAENFLKSDDDFSHNQIKEVASENYQKNKELKFFSNSENELINDQPEVNKTAELNTSDAASLRIDKKNFDPAENFLKSGNDSFNNKNKEIILENRPNYIVIVIFIVVVLMAIYSYVRYRSDVEYDHKALGFDNKSEMEIAFGKGYHTKQRLTEIIGTKEVIVPPTATKNTKNEDLEAIDARATNAIFADDETISTSCDSVENCISGMVSGAARENIGQVLNLVKILDEMPKPSRGDRKLARQFNTEGLEAIKSKNFERAFLAFIKARELDGLDVEVVGNIAFTLNEMKKFAEAEKIAHEALFLNPKRANSWMIFAISKQGQGKSKEALQAMWLVWQFAKDKENLVEFFEKKINEETDKNIRQLYVASKNWLVDGQKPNFQK